MMAKLFRKILIFFLLIVSACNQTNPGSGQRAVKAPDPDSLIGINREMVRNVKDLILQKGQKSGWQLIETGTGLFYEIYPGKRYAVKNKQSSLKSSALIKRGDWVSLFCKGRFLDGNLFFDSREDGPKQFIVEQSPAERGLHEAVQFLSKGDSARIILPPHLGYGLAGDGDRIPGGAILWYEIRVDSVRLGTSN